MAGTHQLQGEATMGLQHGPAQQSSGEMSQLHDEIRWPPVTAGHWALSSGNCDYKLSFNLKLFCLSLPWAVILGGHYHTQPEFAIHVRRI